MPMFLTITCYYDQEIESKLQLLLKESKISMENLEQIEKDESIICPFDSSHRIPKESYANHMVILLIQFHKQWHVHHYNTQFDLNEDIDTITTITTLPTTPVNKVGLAVASAALLTAGTLLFFIIKKKWMLQEVKHEEKNIYNNFCYRLYFNSSIL